MKNNLRLFLLHFIYCIFFSVFSFGQEIEWQNTIGGNGDDRLYSIKQTTDGGYILGGHSNSMSSGDKSENNINSINPTYSYDYWIVKTDSAGNIQWENTIGGTGDDQLYSIQQTADGGYILGGYSESNISGDKNENNIDTINTTYTSDYWIIKIDALGNIQWQNTIGGSGDDKLYSIQLTSDGGYILGGKSNSNISGDKTENSKGDYDYWIVKTDGFGNIQFQNTIGGSAHDDLYSIQQTTDGGYIIGGFSFSNISGDKTEDNCNLTGNIDYWIVKTDSAGIIQWQNTLGGNYGDYLYSIEQTNDGGYILGGKSYSNISCDKTENALGQSDYWLVKTDAMGTIQWQNTIGGVEGETLASVKQTLDGGYILGGISASNISGDKTENNIGVNDYWVVKTDSLGSVEWENTIGSDSADNLYDIQQTSDGGYILGGFSYSNIFCDKTEGSFNNSYDYWIVKLTTNYSLITGNTYADINSNNAKDVNEPVFTNQKITEQNTSRFAFSQQNGFYSVSVLHSGNFSVTPGVVNYYNPVPASHSATFTGNNEIDSLNDFAYQPAGVFNDLCISITPTGPFRPGFNANYVIDYQNVGTTTLNGSINIYPGNVLTFVSSSQIPVSINTDSIVWNVGTLSPFQSGTIIVTFNVSSNASIGGACISSVHIEPVAGDANPSCNLANATTIILGSYDPNDILVNEDTLLTSQLPSQPWLDYTIRFQNTGNDTAFTVNVLNPIDTTKLELSSIEFVNSSHPVNLNWIPWERNMEFKFNNILLPDSNVNEPLSHGFVHYRIKPKTTLLAGDTIKNNAYIYFDFNVPVATNTAITKIVLPTGMSDVGFENSDLEVFPNPAKDEMTITGYALQNNQSAVLKIYDVMGKEVFSQSHINRTSLIIDLKSFNSGVYFLQLQTGAKVSRVKFIKQ